MNRYLLAAAATLTATPALAHHPLGGLPMETFAHGALSGVGHPILGFDHLFFIAAMGIAALFTSARLTAPLAYVAAMVLGCAAAYAGLALPAVETVIVVSILAIGGVILSGRALSLAPALVLFAGFGLFHGAAFSGALSAQEGGAGASVLAGYLIFLAITQYAIAIGAQFVARTVLGATDASSVNARLAGAAVAGVGVFLALETLEGPIVAALTGA
ncbi:HupE/UreJ family protein [Histidinibacterium aquaticum]|uniref:Hydantoin utilization protein A n=1 Tax=Histidinibacterium aquaticum TaxID=2613962 RepID=A0A5J5GFY3_9RHOB|nr:HupE/UreJ family protein [Histidinibacterium aquaticum]KAA9007041.1 hydantoin utilization protein A [Histidinibacterium aquaticum]